MSNIESRYEEEIKKNNSIPEDKKDFLIWKIRKIYQTMKIYESDYPNDIWYLRWLFEARLNNISNIDSSSLNNFLTKSDLFSIWIIEVSKGDTASGLLYDYNINPEKAFLDWNTKLHQWDLEYLTANATMVLRLKKLEAEWILEFWKDNIPKLKPDLPLWRQLEVLQIVYDYVNNQIKNNKDKDWSYQKLKIEIDLLLKDINSWLSNDIKNISEQISSKDIKTYHQTLVDGIKTSKNIPENQKLDIISDISNWFNDDKVDIKLKIATILLVSTLSIAWWYILLPALSASMVWINWLILRMLFVLSNSQRIFPFLTWFVPLAGKSQLDRVFNYNSVQTLSFHSWRLSKDVFQWVSNFLPLIFWKVKESHT